MDHTSKPNEQAIQMTRCWVEQFVIKHRLCPFAAKVALEERIDYVICSADEALEAVIAFEQAILKMDHDDSVETLLLILTEGFMDFEDYLDLLAIMQDYLEHNGYSGTYQLASFHPDYQFQDTGFDDVTNYTNRSPLPIIHVLRESSLAEGLKGFPNPEEIPVRNQKLMTELERDYLEAVRRGEPVSND